jgi:hypothetical protein
MLYPLALRCLYDMDIVGMCSYYSGRKPTTDVTPGGGPACFVQESQ